MSAAPGVPVIQITDAAKGYKYYRRAADRLRELWQRRPLAQIHWALEHISLAVYAGETFGLIGENGAGKSTLLKLVAGTCKASRGQIDIHGQVAALLELGIGFHPEESGRENVYLMGALAGIAAKRMESYYSEIAAFSELSAETLERPVKTYSSGMFMRLAFATATAVDPDILVIDEALSVGDMHFQKKSLDRIMSFRDRGKTVLFCSHNLYQVRSLCQRAAWLHEGRIRAQGDTERVVTAYESYQREKEAAILHEQREQQVSYKPQNTASALAPLRIQEVSIHSPEAAGPGADAALLFETFQPVDISVEVESRTDAAPFHVGIAIIRNDKENVFGTSTHFSPASEPLLSTGRRRVTLQLPKLHLLSGDYWLSVYVLDDSGLQVYDMAEKICPFTVRNPGREFGLVHMPHRWQL